MVGLLIAMFAGLVVLMHLDGIVPRPGQTAVSQLAHHSFGSGPLYGYVQVTTALVLLLAANTAFNGFPRLLSFMARNGHAPRACLRLGDRLAFSNGTLGLALAAAALLVVFGDHTSALIPLYAVGVFVACTLSQAGMVVHWSRQREQHWRKSMLINAVGASLSAIVFVIAAVTKFSQGAWVAIALMVLLVLLAWRIRRHYDGIHDALSLYPLDPSTPPNPSLLAPPPRANSVERSHTLRLAEEDESPDQLRHLAVVPIVRLDLCGLRALAYAASLGQPVLAVHISPSEDEAARFKRYWAAWGDHMPLEIVGSPYHALVAPLASYIDALRTQRSELTLTVILPELIASTAGTSPCTTAPHEGSDEPCDASQESLSPRFRFTCRRDRPHETRLRLAGVRAKGAPLDARLARGGRRWRTDNLFSGGDDWHAYRAGWVLVLGQSHLAPKILDGLARRAGWRLRP
jgi:hypothetical protein